MKSHRFPSHHSQSWSAEELEVREHGVWIARLVASVLAAGWNSFWMGVACVLAGCVATLVVLHRPAPWLRPATAGASAAAAPTTGEPDLRIVREELALLRQRAAELEARQRNDALAAEEERARTVRLLDEERERRVRAEEERDRAREERVTETAPVVMAWPAPPPLLTPVDFQAMLTQQLLQRMAQSMTVTIEPWPSDGP